MFQLSLGLAYHGNGCWFKLSRDDVVLVVVVIIYPCPGSSVAQAHGRTLFLLTLSMAEGDQAKSDPASQCCRPF